MTETSNSSASSVTKIELSVADGSKTTVAKLAKDLMPLLIVVLKADTALCNKQLKAINELEEEGLFANKCTPIAVLLGTLNEIENWESKMQLKYTIVQGTPEFLEQLGCASRGKTKRACVLLGKEDHVEFIDTAIKSGNSFVPKLKEYLTTVVPRPAAAAAPAKGTKKASTATSRASAKKTTTTTTTKASTEPTTAEPQTKAPVEPTDASVEEPTETTSSIESPVAGKVAPKLKVTRKSVPAVEKSTAKKKAPSAAATTSAAGQKSSVGVKRAQSKKRAGVTPTSSKRATTAGVEQALLPSTPGNDDQSSAAAVASTSATVDDTDQVITTTTTTVKSGKATTAAAGAKKTRTSKAQRRGSDLTSDIESPPPTTAAEVAAGMTTTTTAAQSRQRKRIKTS